MAQPAKKEEQPKKRGPNAGSFQPGRSGNPGGRTKGLASATREVLKAAVEAGDDPALAVARFWAFVMSDPNAKMEHRLRASELLADRGWGKAPQYAPIEDDDPLEFAADAGALAEDFDAALDELAARRRAREERIASAQ